jgi:hypothetical protein
MRGLTIEELLNEALDTLRSGRASEISMVVDMQIAPDGELEFVYDNMYTISKRDIELTIQKLLSVKELIKNDSPLDKMLDRIESQQEQIKELQKKWSYPPQRNPEYLKWPGSDPYLVPLMPPYHNFYSVTKDV